MSRNPLAKGAAAALLLALATLAACGTSAPSGSTTAQGHSADTGWVGAWATAPYGPYPLGFYSLPIPGLGVEVPTDLPNDHALEQSFRMIIHPTLGGSAVRVRLSNLVGDQPVTFSPVRIAQSLLLTGPAIVPGTDTPVLFGGQPGVTVAPGDEAVSDPVEFSTSVGDDLAISFHVVGESGAVTWHAVSFGPNYVSLPNSGDTTGDATGLSFPQPSLGWFFVSGLDVLATQSPGAIVAMGDSITDGAYTVLNTRWTDDLAHRLQTAGINMGVLNQGIISNTVTAAASPPGQEGRGEAAVLRFGRDVLQRAGVRSVIIFEGSNDLSLDISADDTYAGIRDMIDRAHVAGLCVVVGTVMPRLNTPIATWTADMEAERVKLNGMLRALTDIEGLADFDKVMALPLIPSLPNAVLYVDQVHPNPLGTQVMADAVPLEALAPPPLGSCGR